jgi:hypothetical protein
MTMTEAKASEGLLPCGEKQEDELGILLTGVAEDFPSGLRITGMEDISPALFRFVKGVLVRRLHRLRRLPETNLRKCASSADNYCD